MDTRPRALVIGAGFTGCALAYDLALRGFHASVFERGDIAHGTSGRTHGLLHSGGRYCVADPEAAVECIEENIILHRIARGCIESNGGLFVALSDADLSYANLFEQGAQACGIPIERLDPRGALALEPLLNPNLLGAYTVPDAAFDPLRLALYFAASARRLGADFYTHTEVTGIIVDESGRAAMLQYWDLKTNARGSVPADVIINATGAWAGEIARLAGLELQVLPTPGVMVALDQRLTQRVINLLAPPGDGDILVPQRRMSLIGTTSYVVDQIDYIPIIEEQVQDMRARAAWLVPAAASAAQRGVWVSARPLIGGDPVGRDQSRTFRVYDHGLEGRPGLITVTGGKATTCRLMAEKAADTACSALGLSIPCQTAHYPLVDYREYYQ